ncbi:MAG TPA: response regulator transcription factor [Planctomycetota bacterium]|nr:response regulator transcription factor [Planctomycetota bacterium]
MSPDSPIDPIRVILVDDHEVVRQGLAQLLGDGAGICVVGQAGTGQAALEVAASTPADVLVLDYSLPDHTGAKVTTQLRRDGSPLRIVILTVHDNVHYVLRAMDAGADGFVVKSDSVEELLRAIRRVHSGGVYVSPRLAEKVEQHQRGPKGHHVGLDKLSQREFELLRLTVRGLSLQECAQQMQVTESTASTYRARMMSKLEMTNNAQLIRFALENGITS